MVSLGHKREMDKTIKWKSEKHMCVHEKDGLVYLTFPSFDKFSWLINGFSTRAGGVSEGYLASLNLSLNQNEPREVTLENYRRISRAIGFQIEDLVLTQQTHTANVIRVHAADRGAGITRPLPWHDVDGMVTDSPDTVLTLFTADCVPLFFVDPVHRAIGVAHSGWRGTAAHIGAVTVRRMTAEFGTRPSDMFAAIGPSICRDCYEVSADVAGHFPDAFAQPGRPRHFQLDLQGANRQILRDAGIPDSHIADAGLCTACNPELLFSHRASGGKRGLLAGFLAVKRPA